MSVDSFASSRLFRKQNFRPLLTMRMRLPPYLRLLFEQAWGSKYYSTLIAGCIAPELRPDRKRLTFTASFPHCQDSNQEGCTPMTDTFTSATRTREPPLAKRRLLRSLLSETNSPKEAFSSPNWSQAARRHFRSMRG